MTEDAIKNRRILIKDIENGQIIADTKIARFDSRRNVVYISVGSLKEMKNYNITAFIFAKNCLYEVFGTVRGVLINNEIEVLLGKNKEKEDRVKTRYPIMAEGAVDAVIIEDRIIKLHKVIYVKTINMSTTGILVKADFGCFAVGDCFSLKFQLENSIMQLKCKVVRIQNDNMLTEGYGCRINELQVEKGTM